MPTATLTTATVETIGKPKDSKHKPGQQYRPVLFVLPTGEQKWKSYALDAPELTWLAKGATYQATIAGDDFTIIQPEGAPNPTAPTPPTPVPVQHKSSTSPAPLLTPSQKRAIAAYINDLGPLRAYCAEVATKHFPPDADPVAIAQAASDLFTAARDRFEV